MVNQNLGEKLEYCLVLQVFRIYCLNNAHQVIRLVLVQQKYVLFQIQICSTLEEHAWKDQIEAIVLQNKDVP